MQKKAAQIQWNRLGWHQPIETCLQHGIEIDNYENNWSSRRHKVWNADFAHFAECMSAYYLIRF